MNNIKLKDKKFENQSDMITEQKLLNEISVCSI